MKDLISIFQLIFLISLDPLALNHCNSLGVEFDTFDVLSDFAIREGIKEYSDWPTIPQVYLKGEFLGGSDILIEMYNSGSLKEKIEIELAS